MSMFTYVMFGGNVSVYRGGLMEVERTIDVGFHSGFGAFERSKRSKIPTKLTIITDWDLYRSHYSFP